jgi:hypothetical protein
MYYFWYFAIFGCFTRLLNAIFYRTSLVYHMNMIKNIIEHRMYTICKSVRFHITSLIYYVNIKCVFVNIKKFK